MHDYLTAFAVLCCGLPLLMSSVVVLLIVAGSPRTSDGDDPD